MTNRYIIIFFIFIFFFSCGKHSSQKQTDINLIIDEVNYFDSVVFVDKNKAYNIIHSVDSSKEENKPYYIYLNNQYNLIYFENSIESIGKNILKGIELSKQSKNDYLLNKQLILLGKFYTIRNNYTEALQVFLEALNYFETIQDSYSLGKIYNGLGILYFDIGNNELAKSYFEKGLKEYIKINDQRGEAVIRSNMANLCTNLNDNQTSIEHKLKVLDNFISLKDTATIVKSYLNLGYSYIESKNFYLAKQYLEKASEFDFYKKSSSLNERINFAYGKIYFYQKEYDKAKQFFLRSYDIANEEKYYNVKLESLDYLSQIAEVLNDTQTQNKYLKKHIALKDSLFSIGSRNKIEDIRLDYNFNKQKLKEEILVNNYHYEQNKTRLLIGLIILAILFAVYVFFSLQKNKNKNLLIKKIENLRLLEESQRVALELEKEKFNNELLLIKAKKQEEDIELKNRELTTLSLQLINKNNLMNEISDVVQNKKILDKDIKEILHKNTNNEKDWKLFKEVFEKVHPDFFVKLQELYPNISKTEIRVCAYIKINMSNNEIANVMNISNQSVIKSRYRIRLKMNLESSQDLDHLIAQI